MKRSPLRRKTPLRAKSSITRTAMKVKPRRPMRPEFRQAVIKRDTSCRAEALWRDVPCSGAAHIHHVLMRSQGGKDTLEDCILVCSAHHEAIHANPERSYSLGLLRRHQ